MAISKSSVINMENSQQQSKTPKSGCIDYLPYILYMLTFVLVYSSIIFHWLSWNFDFSTMQNTCFHPSLGNSNYKIPKMLRGLTTLPVVLSAIFGLLWFIDIRRILSKKIHPVWVKWHLKGILLSVFSLGFVALVYAVIFAIIILEKEASLVLLPDHKQLECDKPIANYLANYSDTFLYPPFGLLAALVSSIAAAYINAVIIPGQQATKQGASSNITTGDSPV